MHSFPQNGDICLLILQTVCAAARWGRTGRALIMVGAVSSSRQSEKTMMVFCKGQGNQSWWGGAAVSWCHCNCCTNVRNATNASATHKEWESSVWLRLFFIFFPMTEQCLKGTSRWYPSLTSFRRNVFAVIGSPQPNLLLFPNMVCSSDTPLPVIFTGDGTLGLCTWNAST